jgi:histidine triad (HIT) family protein
MDDCLFCRIARKELNARVVYEDDEVLAFEDVHPQAPVHALVIPKRHIASLNQLEPGDAELAGRLLLVARQIAEEKNIHLSGYRTVLNTNAEAGQTVFHLHLHVLGGRKLSWPPG